MTEYLAAQNAPYLYQMKSCQIVAFFFLVFLSTAACHRSSEKAGEPTMDKELNAELNYIRDIDAYNEDSLLNVVVEIPAGTNEKWEIEKQGGRLEHQMVNGHPRIIQYLPYPGNYGMVPRSILPKEKGGDGDPLDVIVLGPAVERGTILATKLVGVLRLLDRGEVDDKLIAISEESPLFRINSLHELERDFPACMEIIEAWFTHYKGPDMVVSKGYAHREEALDILHTALDQYEMK